MFIEINKIQIEDRIRKDYGDIEELAKDIKENGLINPPLVTPDYVLIAGERRTRACKFLGYEQIEVNVMTVKNALHKLKLEISENENRKDFSFSEKMKWAKQLKDEYSKVAKEKQATSTGGTNPQLSTTLSEAGSMRTDKSVAKDLDMGATTYRKAEYIAENGDEELIKKLDEGQLSINKAYKTLKQQKQELEKEKEELRNENLNLQQKNNNLKDKLIQAQNKPPVEKVVDNTDYDKVRKIQKELESANTKLDIKNRQIEAIEGQLEIYKQDSEEYERYKLEMAQLTREKSDIQRQIKSSTMLVTLVKDVEELVKDKLAPIKYSRAILEMKNDETVMENVNDILCVVENWCQEMRNIMPNKNNVINVEVM